MHYEYIAGHETGPEKGSLPIITMKGIINVGNTCYFGAIFVALYHVNEVTTFLHSPKILEEQSLKTALLKAYRTLISGISSSSNKTAKPSPKAIMKALAGTNNSSGQIFANDGQQKDAHEAWVTIIDKFMNHMSYPDLKSFFVNLFEFNGSSYLQCGVCQTTRQKVALYYDINLSFPNELKNAEDRLTLKYMLARYYGVETLEDAVGCDNCECNQKTTKYLRLESEPQIAVIVLMRYVCNHQGEASKNTKLVGSLQYIHLSNSAVN